MHHVFSHGKFASFLDFIFRRSAFAPFELGAEDAEETVGAAAEETNAGFGALAVDVVVELQGHGFLAVDGEVDLVGNAYDVHADGGFARGDDGADGEQVRTDGCDQHGVDAGHDDGAVGREIVGSGTSGRGDDDAVRAEGGDELAVNLDGVVSHAGDGAFGDDDVVEGVPLLNGFTVADVLGVHHAANFDLGAVGTPGLEGVVEVGERNLGEKAEGTEVNAEDRGGGAGEGAGCGKEGAIATEDDDEVWLVPGQVDALDALGRVDVGSAVGVEKVVIVACFEPGDQIAEDAGDLGLLRLGDDGGLEHCCLV